MSYASTQSKFSGRKKRPSKAVRSMLAAVKKRDANPLRVTEAMELAKQIKSLMDDFISDIETGWDDPDNDVEGWKPTDEIREIEHTDGAVSLLRCYRTQNSGKTSK